MSEAWRDHDRQSHLITEVNDTGDTWEICWANVCTGLKKIENEPINPIPGDVITLWPNTVGWTIRGKALNGQVLYYRPEHPDEYKLREKLRNRMRYP